MEWKKNFGIILNSTPVEIWVYFYREKKEFRSRCRNCNVDNERYKGMILWIIIEIEIMGMVEEVIMRHQRNVV